jgi:hypothetical protein
MRKHRRKIDQSVDRGQHDGSKHRLRQVGQQPGKKQQAERKGAGGKNESQRSARACLVVDCRLRQATRDGVAVSQRSREVGRTKAQEFPPRVDAIPMLGGERARRGNAFDVGKQQTAGSEWNNPFDVAPVVGTPNSASPNAQATTIASATTASPTGRAGKSRSPSTRSRIATTPSARTRYWM